MQTLIKESVPGMKIIKVLQLYLFVQRTRTIPRDDVPQKQAMSYWSLRTFRSRKDYRFALHIKRKFTIDAYTYIKAKIAPRPNL